MEDTRIKLARLLLGAKQAIQSAKYRSSVDIKTSACTNLEAV
jgi:hypothetical protein